jgi:hypothetical protein
LIHGKGLDNRNPLQKLLKLLKRKNKASANAAVHFPCTHAPFVLPRLLHLAAVPAWRHLLKAPGTEALAILHKDQNPTILFRTDKNYNCVKFVVLMITIMTSNVCDKTPCSLV